MGTTDTFRKLRIYKVTEAGMKMIIFQLRNKLGERVVCTKVEQRKMVELQVTDRLKSSLMFLLLKLLFADFRWQILVRII